MKYKKALIVGRFQPFHFGHLYLIKKTLEIAEKIIIGIGSASIFDENNPLDYDTRRKIIKAVFYKEKIDDRLLSIVPLEDFFDDKRWLENVKEKVGQFDVVVSNNEWTNKIMEKAGYKVKRFPYYRRELYEGWRIRKLLKQGKYWLDRIPKYLKNYLTNHQPLATNHFNYVVIGGTFDHFHKGHKEFIKTAFKFGKNVTIGITTEKLCKNKFLSETIEDFEIRKKSVSDFLIKNSWHKRAKIISIDEFTGGADKIKGIDAIVVSRQTYPNALKINELREKNNLRPLRIIVTKDVLAEDGKLLSSERIRAGEIDRSGRSYELWVRSYGTRVMGYEEKVRDYKKKELILPDSLREKLRKPLGQVFKNTKELLRYFKTLKWVMLIAVGDIVVGELIKNGIDPDVKIIDFRSRRKPLNKKSQILNHKSQINSKSQISNSKRLEFGNSDLFGTWNLELGAFINKSGTINIKTAEKLKEIINRKSKKLLSATYNLQPNYWLVIDGEEDLLTLPAILFAPLGSLVLYGHFQYGVVGVVIDEIIKSTVLNLLKKFS